MRRFRTVASIRPHPNAQVNAEPLLANAITALREAPAWHGVLAYDQFAMETVIGSFAALGHKVFAMVLRAMVVA